MSDNQAQAGELISSSTKDPLAFKERLAGALKVQDIAGEYGPETIESLGVTARNSQGQEMGVDALLHTAGLAPPTAYPTPSAASNSVTDDLKDLAKKSVEGLTPAEIGGIVISALCAILGLIFTYRRYTADKKKNKMLEENAELERRKIKLEMQKGNIDTENAKLNYESKKMDLQQKHPSIFSKRGSLIPATAGEKPLALATLEANLEKAKK